MCVQQNPTKLPKCYVFWSQKKLQVQLKLNLMEIYKLMEKDGY